MKVWYLLSVCFFLANIQILRRDSREVHFCKTDEEADQQSFSFCLSIDELVADRTFSYSDVYLPKEMIDKVAAVYLPDQRDSLNLSLSYIFHQSVCFEIADLAKFNRIFSRIRKFRFKLFFRFTSDSLLYFFNDVYTHNPIMDKSFDLMIGFLKIRFLEAPYSSNCTKYKWYNGQREIFSKLNCLLRCYKSTYNHTLFYYNYHEHVPLHLCAYRFQSTNECEEFCRERYDCDHFLMFVYLKFKKGAKKLDDPEIEKKGFVFKAYPVIREWNFYIQFASLVTLLFNTSFNQVMISSSNLLRDLLNRTGGRAIKRLVKMLLPKLRRTITVVCFLALVVVSALSIRQYFAFHFRTATYTLPTDQRSEFSLAICLPVQLAYSSQDLSNAMISAENELLYENDSVLQVEERTNRLLDQSINDVHIQSGGLNRKFKVQPANQSIFKTDAYIKRIGKNETQLDLLSRCFRIDLNVREPKYIRASAFSEIIFNMIHPHFQTFYLDYKKRISSYDNSTAPLSKLYIQKFHYLQAPYASDCLVYEDTYGCYSRDACIDCTYNKWFIGNHSAVPASSVIYREDFEEFDLAKMRFSREEDQSLRKTIESTYPNKDCFQLIFNEELQQDQILKDGKNKIIVDLYYFREIRYEVEELTFVNLLLLIFNYQTLIVGLNLRGLADWVLGVLRSSRRIRAKWHGVAKQILNGICIGAFLVFTFNVVDESVSGELARSTYFEKVKEIYLPGFTFCFPLDLDKVDPHRKMTKEYMDELSEHLMLTRIFDKATYFDADLYERNLSFNDAQAVRSFFRYKPYYAYQMKCFDFFASNVTFSERELFHLSELFFLKIYLKPEVYSSGCNDCLKIFISFFEEGLGDFERLAPYYLRKKQTTKVSLRIRPNLIEVDYNDKFFFVRKPLSLFNSKNIKNPDLVYFAKVKRNFIRRTNCVTNMIYVIDENGLEFRDDLFDQYFKQKQKIIDQSLFTNPNFVTIFYNINPIATFEPSTSPELVFVPLFIKIRQIITSKVNVAELIVNILNGLSFFLSRSCLDIRIDLHRPLMLLAGLHSLLRKLKNVLNPNKFL